MQQTLSAGQSARRSGQGPESKPLFGTILRVIAGNFLEQFDFFLFGFYATNIAAAFFASGSDFASLMKTFAVFVENVVSWRMLF